MKKVCIACKIEKEENRDNFYFRKDSSKYRNTCISCKLNIDKIYYNDNKIDIIARNNKYYQENKEHLSREKKKYTDSNKDYWKKYQKSYYEVNIISILEQKKLYYQENKSSINQYRKEYVKSKRKTDPHFSIRVDISSSILKALRSNEGSKKGESCLSNLGYTLVQLCEHLETHFAPWMNWQNRGKYNHKTWDDNDPSTWTWQIDHIIPHSKFKYSSMKDEEFKRCWSLENLRPYSAKQNILDGNRS